MRANGSEALPSVPFVKTNERKSCVERSGEGARESARALPLWSPTSLVNGRPDRKRGTLHLDATSLSQHVEGMFLPPPLLPPGNSPANERPSQLSQ